MSESRQGDGQPRGTPRGRASDRSGHDEKRKAHAEAHLTHPQRRSRPSPTTAAGSGAGRDDGPQPSRPLERASAVSQPCRPPGQPGTATPPKAATPSASRHSLGTEPRAGSRPAATTPSSSRLPSWSTQEYHLAAQSSSREEASTPASARGHSLSTPETYPQPKSYRQTREAIGSHSPSVPSTIRRRSSHLSPPPPHHSLPRSPETTTYPFEASPVGSGRPRSVQEPSGAPLFSPGGSQLDSFAAHQADPFLQMEEDEALEAERRRRAQDDIRKLLKMPAIEIPPEERASTPFQMSCRLMEHQKVALKWLKDQENNRYRRGGLLADTMGLGKTIEALALILAHPAPVGDPKTTLIIAPLALLKQWDQEIADKVKPDHKLSTYLYHGREKMTRKASRLFDFDIVITTYDTVSWEYKDFLNSRRKHSRIFGQGKTFHRIILDEAHKIKNRSAQCSVAVAQLDATYRLCMTGTVFMNNVAEIYALIRFLRIKPYDDWSRFNVDIGGPLHGRDEDEQAAGMCKLQVLFRSITLRRTKDSHLDGEPIITLPALTITRRPAVFDKDQEAFYRSLQERQQIRLNRYLKRGSSAKTYTFMLVLLLRLRQACDHPFLIKNHGIPDEAQLSGKQMLQLAMKLDQAVVDRIMRKERFRCPVCGEATETPMIIYPCGHYICPECFSSMMQVVLGAKTGQALETSAEAPQLSLLGDTEMESSCPHDGCEEEINPKTVVFHDFFLDAHAPDDGSQDAARDIGTDQEDDSLSESEPEPDEDDTADEASLRDFIAPDDEEEAVESEDDEMDEEVGMDKDTQTGDPELNLRSSAGRTPAQVDRADTSDAMEKNEKRPSRSKEDIWSRVMSRYQQSKEEKNDVDSDSGDSIVSILNWTAKAKFPEVDSLRSNIPEESTTSKKRPASSKAASTPKRVKGEEGDKISGKASKPDSKSTKKKKKQTGERKELTLARLKKAASGSKAARAKYLARLRKDFVSSAKIDVTLDLLRAIRRDKPGEKTLVFSLWTSFLDLLEIPLQDAGFRYLRYDGSMGLRERDDSVRQFAEDPAAQVMLVSLLAGSAGLNLTAASQVVVLEPFWNPFVEDQAVDRAHRIGQRRDVEVHRLLVANTVEDRIQELQEKKRQLVGAALSEEGAQGAGRLSIGELKRLFGIR